MERDNVERLKAIKKLNDLHNLIDEIEIFWNNPFFDEKKARKIIQEVNRKHYENVVLYNLTTNKPKANFSNSRSGVSIDAATSSQLQEDLLWKHFYLNAKLLGKGVEEIIKEWKYKSR